MPGMAYTQNQYRNQRAVCAGSYGADCIPDLTDPATMGCLLALVREGWKDDDFASYRHDTNKWRVEIGTRAFTSDSEAAALVAALEAAK
jgi:hypothetical protein